jgi:hypothetical protein
LKGIAPTRNLAEQKNNAILSLGADRSRSANSHEIQAGDVIIGRDGKTHTVTGVSQRFESEFKVSNLTIEELHNYSVGANSILVHNDAICDEGVEWLKGLLASGEASYDDIARFLRNGGYSNADDVLRRLAPTRVAPKLPPFVKGGKTSGVLRTPSGDVPLRSGWEGPASSVPKGTSGFDIVTRTHVEGHAAAYMRQHGLTEATVYINNPAICPSCTKLLERMLPKGSTLNVVLPDGTVVPFTGM